MTCWSLLRNHSCCFLYWNRGSLKQNCGSNFSVFQQEVPPLMFQTHPFADLKLKLICSMFIKGGVILVDIDLTVI